MISGRDFKTSNRSTDVRKNNEKFIHSAKWLAIYKGDFSHYQENSAKDALRAAKANILHVMGKSTLHGVQSFASRRVYWLLKIAWIFCIAASWSYFGYQTYTTMVLYQTFPKITTISKHSEPTLDFPAVDICDLNAYDGGVTRSYMDWVLESKNISTETSSTLREYIDNANYQLKSYVDFLWTQDNFDTYYAGFWLFQILLGCEFQGRACTQSDFYWYHDYYYGNCYRFNGGADIQNQTRYDSNYIPYPTQKSYKTGWRNGLRLELYAGSQSEQIQYAYKTGFRIIVHNQSVVPFPDQDGIDTPAGTQTNIGLKRKFLSRLPSPYSNCIDQLTEDVAKQNDILAIMYQKKELNEIKQYQANYCMGICFQNFIVKTCNCSSLSLGLLNLNLTDSQGNKIEGCYQTDDVNCMIEGEKEFYNSDAVNECYASCPNECNVMSYDLKISQSTYSTKWYTDVNDAYYTPIFWLQYDDDCLTYDCLRKSGSIVNIYYESKDYTVIKETPQYTLDYLVGNLGGNLSLFTGMSFLSFFEVVELFLSFLIILTCYEFIYKKK